MDVCFDNNRLILTDAPMIFSVLLNDYASHLVIDLSATSLHSMEGFLFKEWKRILLFRTKNGNVVEKRNNEVARIEYDNAEQIANQNASYLIDSFSLVAVSCTIEPSDLCLAIKGFEKYLDKKSGAGRFDSDLRMHMAEFVRKSYKLVSAGEIKDETDLPPKSYNLLCAKDYIIPKALRNDVDFANMWVDDMSRLEKKFPIGVVSNATINAEVRM